MGVGDPVDVSCSSFGISIRYTSNGKHEKYASATGRQNNCSGSRDAAAVAGRAFLLCGTLAEIRIH